MEKFGGIDRRRSLPPLFADHFRRWFARHTPAPSAGRYGRVILLDDCFTTYQEPHIGIAAVGLLERAGYQVELAGVFARHGAAYCAQHVLVPAQQRAVRAIQACRTEQLGGHLWRDCVK